MKAIKILGATVTCDECDFEVKVDHIEEYLHKSCPTCGAVNLITDNDIETYNAMMSLMETMGEIVGKDTISSVDNMVKVSVKITDGKIKEIG